MTNIKTSDCIDKIKTGCYNRSHNHRILKQHKQIRRGDTMRKLKGISIILVICVVLSSLPFSVSALQYSQEETIERASTPAEEEELGEIDATVSETTEVEEETSDEPNEEIIEDKTGIELGEESTQEPLLVDDQEPVDSITILDGECLVLGEDGRFIRVGGVSTELPMGIIWSNYEGYYDEDTTIIVKEKATIGTLPGLDKPVKIGRIESGASAAEVSSLQILQGSNIEINSKDNHGIVVSVLQMGHHDDNSDMAKVKIITNASGILADNISVLHSDLNITSGETGIKSHLGSPSSMILSSYWSNITVHAKGPGASGIHLGVLRQGDSNINVVSDKGTGLIGSFIDMQEGAKLEAVSMTGANEKGIVVSDLINAGTITGKAIEGNGGIEVKKTLSTGGADSNVTPRFLGEAKTGYGISIGMDGSASALQLSVGAITGKVGNGIGLRFKKAELHGMSTLSGDKQLIGIAERGYGICAQSIDITGDGWQVKGDAKGALNTALFEQAWMPKTAGILLTDTLQNAESIHLVASGSDITIEGNAPLDVAESHGIFVYTKNNNDSSSGRIHLISEVGTTTVNATGDTGIYAFGIRIEEDIYSDIENMVLVTANGEVNGITASTLNIYGIGPNTNEYRVKATGKHGNGLNIVRENSDDKMMILENASVEAIGGVNGIYTNNQRHIVFSSSSIKGTGKGLNSVTGIYLDNYEGLFLAGGYWKGMIEIWNSDIVAESETYGWYSQNYVIVMGGYPTAPTNIEALGAEVGMYVGIDLDRVELDTSLVTLRGGHFRKAINIKAVAKTMPPDRATKSAFYFDKVAGIASDDDSIQGVFAEGATIIEEYRTKAEQPIGVSPVWPYGKGLNMDKIMNFTWLIDNGDILIEKTAEGIKSIQGNGEATLEISREGNAEEEDFLSESIILGAAPDNGEYTWGEADQHIIILTADFGLKPSGGSNGGNGGNIITEPETPSTEATTSSEIDPEATTEEDGVMKPSIVKPGGGGNNENGNGSSNKGNGKNPVVPWKNGRPNTGDISIQYVISAFVLLSIISGAYIYTVYRKKKQKR